MEKLRKVLTQTTWANASDAINKNSDRIYEAITRVENATTKNKGYFETSNALLDTYPNPSVGDIAFVFNSANTIDTPYDVYKTAFSSTTNTYEWYDSGINAPFADVDINSVKDSIRDIEQQVDTLKDPRLPIICDANGRIGLNVGNGLYVDSNGDLCATQSIGGGSGSGSGGESYYAADGISINEDNFISVKIGASLEFDKDNALKVGTGEGLVHNSNGKLSVNVGKGLVIDNKTNAIELEDYDAIKEIPIAIQKKQDKLIEGSGIEITSENVINVDGSNLQVQLSTNAINDEDGKRIKTTYAKKEEVDGIYGAIEATNTTVASHTKSIGSLELNKQDKLEFGNGLSTVGNLVKVEDAVLKDVVDNKKNIDTLSSSISGKQDKLTASDGINLDDGKLSVHIGTGLEFDPLSSAVVVKMGAGVKTDINQSLTIKHDATLTTDAQGQLGVNQGTITNIAASEVAKVVANAPANFDTLKEIADYIATDAEGAAQLSNRIGAVESALPNKQDTISDLSTIRSNAANGATAYGWGYHGTAGYAKKAKVNGSTYEADSNGVINLPSYPTSLPASDVYAWAKVSSKPSYSWSEINNKPDVATKEDLNNKQDTLTFGSGLTNTNGVVTVDYKTASVKWSNISEKPTFATVATSGSYNDLSNKPTIPSAVTESTVSGWGFTKNTGTYSKPSGGIPKSDLASSVQTSLSNADTAYGWGSHRTAGYAKKVKVGNTTYEADAGAVVSLPAYPTSLPANGGNADTVGGLLPRNVDIFFTQAREKELDLTALDSNYYYPCSVLLTHVSPTQIRIWCSLGDRPIPSWATHSDGFVLNLEWEAVGCGWGTTSVQRKITTYHYAFSDKSPCGDITQNTMPSEEIVFLRGGAKYFYHTSNGGYFVVHPNGYSWSSGDRTVNHPIRPLSEAVDVWSCSDNSALGIGAIVTNYVYGTAEKADKLSTPRTIWGQSFDGSGDVAGIMRKVSTIHFGNQPYGERGIYQGNWYADNLTEQDVAFNFVRTYFTGNVGIGTTAPQYKLDVNGSLNATSGYINGNPLIHTGNIGDGFENVGNTIKISTSYIAESLKGDGLVLGENGKMSVDSSKVVTIEGTQIISGHKQFTEQLSITKGRDLELCAADASPNDAGDIVFCNNARQEIGRFWLDVTEPRKFLIRYGGNDSGKVVIHSGNIADYVGSLSANYAHSAGSVAWSNVSGRPSFGNGLDSTNNVVQLKLSTGLAIDDRGYLYVTGL